MALVTPATPPMGWNGFNHYGPGMTAAQVVAGADALVSSGMAAAGYEYVNIDGGWNSLTRTPGGDLQPNPSLYPDGIQLVVDHIHSLGLKAGIYLSAGRTICARTSAGSWGHYRKDAQWVAGHGFDFVKLDYCNMPESQTPLTDSDVQADAELMATELAATGRPILLDVNPARAPHGHVWRWARSLGAGMWRVSPDLRARFTSMVKHLGDMLPLGGYAGPGGWNDPDMLQVGNGMTPAEDRAQFTLWAVLAAPLIAGNDLTHMDAATREVLTNAAVIAIGQDPAGEPGHLVKQATGRYVIARPLAGGDVAVVLFNASDSKAAISTTAAACGLPTTATYRVVNVWSGETTTSGGTVRNVVGAHAVSMYRISPQ